MPRAFLMKTVPFLLATAGTALGQTTPSLAAAPLSFEVAAVKASGPLDTVAIASGKAHIGMTVDQARVDIGSMPLGMLICMAFKVANYQLSGPDWLNSERFDILAKMPDGATKEQVPEMLKALLAERFKLQAHLDKRDRAIYALVVGKGGPKLKESPPEPVAPAAAETGPEPSGSAQAPSKATPAKGELVVGNSDNPVRVKSGPNGMEMSSKDTGWIRMSMDSGTIHLETERLTMEGLAAALSQYGDRPVKDFTELKGKFQVTLDISMSDALRAAGKLGIMPPGAAARPAPSTNASPADEASDPSGTSLFASILRLGLKLEPRKVPYDFLIVDHIERTPTEN